MPTPPATVNVPVVVEVDAVPDVIATPEAVNPIALIFPDTFKTFKIKVNANTQELQNYLDEMDSIVECDNVEQFLLDSILQCIKLLEGVSSYTKYDIQGLAVLLKQVKQFYL